MEQNWIVRLKAGDIAALQEIMQTCTSYVYTILRNISRNKLSKEDLEELTADVFVQLWRSRTRLSEDMPLSPYLAAIARNCAKNRFRALGKQPPKKRKRFMHPLIAIAAVIGISTLSLVTANAATDGALFSKLTLYLNGEQVETNIRFVEETDDKIVYEVLPEDSEGNIDPFQITQDKDGGAGVAMNGTGNASEAELEIEMDVQE